MRTLSEKIAALNQFHVAKEEQIAFQLALDDLVADVQMLMSIEDLRLSQFNAMTVNVTRVAKCEAYQHALAICKSRSSVESIRADIMQVIDLLQLC